MVKIVVDGLVIETERHHVTLNDDNTIDIDTSVLTKAGVTETSHEIKKIDDKLKDYYSTLFNY